MKRYQVYLNPQSVAVVDAYNQDVDLGRSHVLRLMADAVSRNLIQLLPTKKTIKGPLDDGIGIIKTKGKKTTFSSRNIDEIYFVD